MNGAECIDGINEYTCQCQSGWNGTLCQYNIDDCFRFDIVVLLNAYETWITKGSNSNTIMMEQSFLADYIIYYFI